MLPRGPSQGNLLSASPLRVRFESDSQMERTEIADAARTRVAVGETKKSRIFGLNGGDDDGQRLGC
jgi:hypothetical protein